MRAKRLTIIPVTGFMLILQANQLFAQNFVTDSKIL
jgi:hypothetical protein